MTQPKFWQRKPLKFLVVSVLEFWRGRTNTGTGKPWNTPHAKTDKTDTTNKNNKLREVLSFWWGVLAKSLEGVGVRAFWPVNLMRRA